VQSTYSETRGVQRTGKFAVVVEMMREMCRSCGVAPGTVLRWGRGLRDSLVAPRQIQKLVDRSDVISAPKSKFSGPDPADGAYSTPPDR